MVGLKCETHLRRKRRAEDGASAFVVGYQICLALDVRGRLNA